METIYEERMATKDKDVMLLRAIVEPMLIRARRQDTTKETRMLFMGTSQPGRTCESS